MVGRKNNIHGRGYITPSRRALKTMSAPFSFFLIPTLITPAGRLKERKKSLCKKLRDDDDDDRILTSKGRGNWGRAIYSGTRPSSSSSSFLLVLSGPHTQKNPSTDTHTWASFI
jgi:hypothetical protein